VSEDNDDYVDRVPDASVTRRRGSAFVRVTGRLLGLVLLCGLLLLGGLGWGWAVFTARGPLQEAKVVDLSAGMGRTEIAHKLASEGVISDARVMSAVSLVSQLRGGTVLPGEYEFPAKATMADVLDIIQSGRVLTYKLTIPEGWTSEMAVARINQNDVLDGNDVSPPVEGSLIADTQVFRRGMTRAKLLQDMQAKQAKLIDDVWAKNPPGSPLTSKEQMVTLASIVEKETAKADERPKIAAVFLNRLKKNMRLQSDPTIIYGLVGGKGKLERALTRADIDSTTPYNTYQIDGLPPGPIATPGRASLEAVVAPAQTQALYFVADGTGGHAFAVTLDEHNANVKKWREAVKSGILLPEGNNGTVSPDPEKLVPEVQQTPLPAVDDVDADGQVPAATDDAAVAEAAATKEKTLEVPQPKESEAAEAKPIAAQPPPLPVEKKVVDVEPVTGTETDPPAAAQPVADARAGTVVKVGAELVPIPLFKPPKQ
jgi:UPF0755 protein